MDDVPGQFAEVAGRVAAVARNIASVVACAADAPGRIKLTLRVARAERWKVLGVIAGLEGLELLHE